MSTTLLAVGARTGRVALGIALPLAWWMMAAQPAVAQTYIVATDGNDSAGTGSSAAPWATITHALNNVPDGATVLVQPGTYSGRVRLVGSFAQGVTVRAAVPYQSRLRALSETVVTCYDCQGVTLEGFDIAHAGPGAGALVIQIQDLIGAPGGSERTSRVVLRDNVIHDSYNNDLLKVNNGASDVLVEGNLFYNQSGSDEHIDVNSVTDVVIQDNVFFNDFEGSGRINPENTSSYIVIKDSNGDSDGFEGARRVAVRRNVFANWQGSTGSNFVLIGEDGQPYHEAREVLVENNLLLGNSDNVLRAPFGVKGGRDVVFRHNTVVGDLPSLAYAMRLNTEGANPANDGIAFFNNVWSDPTGTMGAENPSRPNDFSDTPVGQTLSFSLDSNAYWNGGAPIPADSGERVNFTDDPSALVADPGLPAQGGLVLPRWNEAAGRFADGSVRIADAFRALVEDYGTPVAGSALVDAGNPLNAAADDILGRLRNVTSAPDLGAVELPDGPLADLAGLPILAASIPISGVPDVIVLVAFYLLVNIGDEAAGPFELAVLAPGSPTVELARQPQAALGAGEFRPGLVVQLLSDTAVDSVLLLKLDPDALVPESRTDNNLVPVLVPAPGQGGRERARHGP